MPWNTLLLPLLAGWAVLNFHHYFRPSARRYEGQRLVLTSAAVGVALLLIARICTMVGEAAVPQLAAAWQRFAPFEHSGVSSMTVVLAALIVGIGNPLTDPKDSYRRVVEQRDDHLEQLFFRSLTNKDSLSFTLKSGKVYVGQVLRMPTDLANERRYARLLPILSGYRDPTTHRLTFTTDYSKVYARMGASGGAHAGSTADEFALVIPIAEVATASLFDWDVYEWFNEPDPATAAA